MAFRPHPLRLGADSPCSRLHQSRAVVQQPTHRSTNQSPHVPTTVTSRKNEPGSASCGASPFRDSRQPEPRSTRPSSSHPRTCGCARRQILSLLASSDRNGLILGSRILADRFDQVTGTGDANDVAWSCSLVPNVHDRLDVVVRLAERAVENTSVGQRNTLNSLGAALYRAGRFRDAIGRLEEGVKVRSGVEGPLDWPFLAMAHHRLGHRDEARRWLDRLRNHQPSDDTGFRTNWRSASSAARPRPSFSTTRFSPADPVALSGRLRSYDKSSPTSAPCPMIPPVFQERAIFSVTMSP